MNVVVDAIPVEFRVERRFIVWKHENVGGKPKKTPYRVDFARRASSTEPGDWASFDEALGAVERGVADGVGYALPKREFVLVDLDDAVNEDGKLHPAAGAILDALDSYSEWSQSRSGAHVLVRGRLNGGRHQTRKTPWGGKFEAWDTARFVYLTGELVHGVRATIEPRQNELEQVLAEFLPPAAPAPPPPSAPRPVGLDDQELLERAFVSKHGDDLRMLYAGGWQGRYASQSEADLALCGHLAFWTGRDRSRIDALFRSSGLMRPKWDARRDETSYGELTIAKAVEGTSDVYSPPGATSARENSSRPRAQAASSSDGQADWDWPAPLSDAAFHGVAGDVVRVIEPETQADPAAVLLQLLTAVGAACGRGAGFTVDESRHGVNLFVQIVGDSGTSRKGSSFARAIAPVLAADATFSHTTGLSSGEGLIWEVRDPIEKRRRARSRDERERADEDGYITELLDEGVHDKRILIAETEFASVLARMGREGNTLSAVIRQAWEGSTLRTMTKGTPAVATGAHVSIVAHITAEELRQKLSQVDALSGFANRFLWVCAKRSKSLPRGGRQIEWRDSTQVDQIRQAIRFAQLMPDVDFDDEAGELWDSEYERLETSRTGLLAAVTNRASAQTRRIATLYAILDCTDTITVEHLAAALAIWAYCESSARFLFSDRTGNPTADRTLEALRKAAGQGLSRTDIRDMFGRNVSAAEIEAALSLLLFQHKVRREIEETGGRPAERWWAL